MATQTATRHKTTHPAPRLLRAQKRKNTRRDAGSVNSAFTRVGFHVCIFIIAFLIVCSRRPDVVLNPQFYAEDGAYWFADAYRVGLHSLLLPQSGYLHALTRIVALATLLVPFSYAPLIMNLSAIAVQILPVNVLLSCRFSNIALRTRLLASFIYLALPNSFETNANITNLLWRLAVLAFLLLVRPPENWPWKIFDGTVFVLTCLDGPMGILLVPLVAALWWKRREKWQIATLWLLAPAAVVQAITVMTHLHLRQAPHFKNLAGQVIVDGGPNGATFGRLITILGRQIFFSSLLGLNGQRWFEQLSGPELLEATAATIGVALLVYALCRGPLELKLSILFAFATLGLGLARPIAGTPARPQWQWLCFAGCGNRYYFLPMLAFLASLIWMATRTASHLVVRSVAIALLLLLPIGIYQDWQYAPFVDYHFERYAQRFDRAPAGTKAIIPINPGWRMELTKR